MIKKENGIEDINNFLNRLVETVRNIVNDDSMINKCDLVQGLIGRYFDQKGLKYWAVSTHKCIMPNIIGHSFVVLNYSDNLYLIDPAYVQFKYDDSYKDIYVEDIRVKSNSPYYYAKQIGGDIIEDLIDKGYMPLTQESAYLYGNSFYHTLLGIPKDYKFSNISGNVYIDAFKRGNDKLQQYSQYAEIKDGFYKK